MRKLKHSRINQQRSVNPYDKIMEITSDTLEFTSEDVIAWKNFLNTRTGQRLIPKLLEGAPTLLSSGDTNAVLIRNGELLGYQSAARNLLFLANPPTERKSVAAFPDLTDDDAWNDGHKIK